MSADNPTNPQDVPALFNTIITAYAHTTDDELTSFADSALAYRKAFFALFDMGCEEFIGNDEERGQVIIISRPPSEYPTLKVKVLCKSPYRLVMSSDGLVYEDGE